MARGKKVFTVEWEKDGIEITVPVKVFKVPPDYTNDYEGRIIFRAEYVDANLSVEGTDADKIRKKIIKKLDEWFNITWELFILVAIHGGHRNPDALKRDEECFNVTIETEYVAVGTSNDGNIVHMRVPHPDVLPDKPGEPWAGTRFSGVNPKAGLPETGTLRREHSWKRERLPAETYSLIPATKENYAALMGFVRSMQTLLDKMHEHFHPDCIMELLSSPGLVLPAPESKKKAKKKKRSTHA